MTQRKFGRNYSLSIELQDLTVLTVTLPFTIEFDITRHTLSSANVCQIRIYNLSQDNRDLIRYDFSNFTTVRRITLMAGYGTNLPIVFSGNITQAWSVREGVNFITTIECFDGGYAFINGVIPDSTIFPAGTPLQTIYKTLMSYLGNVSFGAIGPSFIRDSSGALLVTSRSTSYTGNAADVLTQLTGKAFFVDNGKSYILSDDECITGQVAVINASSGLLNTPLRENSIVSFEMIFEPGIVIGQLIQLISSTNSDSVNGFYKITSIKHKGMISESVCGDAITMLEFFLSSQQLIRVTS